MHTKAGSYKTAKKLAEKHGIKSHPYYWANYVLSGNTNAIK